MMKRVETGGASVGPYSPGIVAGGFIFTSGQIPIDAAGGLVGEGDVARQAEQCIQNLAAVLKAGGSCMDRVVKTTCYLKEMSDFEAFNQVYAAHFTQKPARSCVAVKQLPRDVLCEIEAVAVVAGG